MLFNTVIMPYYILFLNSKNIIKKELHYYNIYTSLHKKLKLDYTIISGTRKFFKN